MSSAAANQEEPKRPPHAIDTQELDNRLQATKLSSSDEAAGSNSIASPTSPTQHHLPPSILRSSSFHVPSRPATPDTTSIHFSSGAHPEHHVVNHQDVHPASRPSSIRRISAETIPGVQDHRQSQSVPAADAAAPVDATPRSAMSTSSASSAHSATLTGAGNHDDGQSSSLSAISSSEAGPHGILKHTGQANYGGRLGKGPALPSKSRTASSGGLSADIKPGYERRVGFDSMIDADETASGTFGFTLQVKSHEYRRTRNTRTFMCAVDSHSFSERALEWLMESLVEDNDEIVAVRVLEGDPDLIDQEEAREAAKELMSAILVLNEEVPDRKISIVVEFIAGRVTSTIIRLIHMYRPDSLIIGTRGRSVNAFQKLIGGSMIGGNSRDILSRSPVPVVVVRPEAKVAKHLRQRQADPKRRSYHHLVAKADDLPLSKPKPKPKKLLGHHSHASVSGAQSVGSSSIASGGSGSSSNKNRPHSVSFTGFHLHKHE